MRDDTNSEREMGSVERTDEERKQLYKVEWDELEHTPNRIQIRPGDLLLLILSAFVIGMIAGGHIALSGGWTL